MYRPAIAAMLMLAAAAPPSPGDPVLGVWANPKGSLAVRTAPCGAMLCGAIVNASATALADARDAGVPGLIGLQLLRDYRRVGDRAWRGQVYVPDMGRSFSSRIEQLSPDTLRISGCVIGAFFCKSQLWHRVQ